MFLSDGVHFITLEVIDSLGASDLTSVEIRVTLPPTSFDEESPLLYSVNFLVVVVLVRRRLATRSPPTPSSADSVVYKGQYDYIAVNFRSFFW